MFFIFSLAGSVAWFSFRPTNNLPGKGQAWFRGYHDEAACRVGNSMQPPSFRTCETQTVVLVGFRASNSPQPALFAAIGIAIET